MDTDALISILQNPHFWARLLPNIAIFFGVIAVIKIARRLGADSKISKEND